RQRRHPARRRRPSRSAGYPQPPAPPPRTASVPARRPRGGSFVLHPAGRYRAVQADWRCHPHVCNLSNQGFDSMNLTPTEQERLTIFTAAEFARRNRSLGIRLSHPEAVALITDEVMTAVRRDLSYEEVRDLAGRLLTTD